MIASPANCSPNLFEDELQKQYELFEKLHCLVVAEKFIILKKEMDVLYEIIDVKAKVLQEIEDKRTNLSLLQSKLTESVHNLSSEMVHTALSKLRNLIMEIIRIQKANARFLSELANSNK